MKLLEKLTQTPGVPGREERIREVIAAEAKKLCDQVRIDALGNLICRKKPGKKSKNKAVKVMIACHMDEIGFYVRAIDEQGRLRVQKAGGFDPRNLLARRVLVQGKKDLIGVMNPALRPIHLASDEELKKQLKVSDFYVDLFLPKDKVEELVRVGDPITLIQPLEQIGDCWTGKALDNRIACWIGLNVLKQIGRTSACDIYLVATVQEEVGCRGALTSAFEIDADYGVAIDVTLSCDTPGVDKTDAVSELGKGVAIKVMDGNSISHRPLVDEFVALAEKKKIPHQLEILPLGGTDAGNMQRAGAGRKAITLSVPARYVHTVTETVHRQDAQAAVDLLAAWLSANPKR